MKFFKDRKLTRPANDQSPQWLIVSEAGGAKEATLWLGNEAFGVAMTQVNPGETLIPVTNAQNFPPFGFLRVGQQHLRYSGNDGVRLTGIPDSGDGAVTALIPNGFQVRCENREFTEGNLVVSTGLLAHGTVQARSLAQHWVRTPVPSRLDSSYSLNGSDLFCSVEELTGADVLLHYDFTGSDDVRDLTQNHLDAVAQNGSFYRGAASPFLAVAAKFDSGACLLVDQLGNVFPDTGSLELWVRDATPLCTLFSMVDRITSSERFAVKVNTDSTIRVVQELASGLLKTYNGFVPLADGWNQVVVTWDARNISVFINGALESAYEIAEPIDANSGQGYFGKGSQASFTGALCKVRIWKTRISGDRVATSWNGGQSWMPQENEPVLAVRIRATADAGGKFSETFSVRTQPISGYSHDPVAIAGSARFVRRNNGLRSQMRILPLERKMSDALPAFVWGEYRWRENEESSASIVPANWDADLSALGDEMFTSGIGQHPDLELLRLEKVIDTNSIVPAIRGGEYFIGKERSFLPVKPVLDIIDPGTAGPFTLSARPRKTTPVFVGRWRSNQVDRYVKDIDCRYVGQKFSAAADFDPDDSGFQFRLNRKANQVLLNRTVPAESGFIGVFPSTEVIFTFRLPVHPVFSIERIYLANGRSPKDWTFDQQAGTVRVEIDPSERSMWARQLVYAEYTPALGVLYDASTDAGDVFTADVELNPAFAGVADGYLYLQHKIWQPKQVQLQVDKPRIPYVTAATPEQVQFGPVMPADFAVLTATVFGNSSSELISGARLKVQVDPAKFTGAVNYQDPTKMDVWITSGADGSASLVYTPGNTFGQYIALASITDNVITLPDPIDLEQIFDDNTGQMVLHTYAVMNDDPYLGKTDAETAAGEIAWQTSGTPGTSAYKTNGRRLEWKTTGGAPVFPSDLQDAAHRSYLDPAFSGQVQYIIYGDDVLQDARIGAYFVAFVGKVTIRLYSPAFNVLSNPITLRIVPPEQITESSFLDDSVWAPIAGYLTMNDFAQLSGRMNVNRLAGGPLLQLRFSKRV